MSAATLLFSVSFAGDSTYGTVTAIRAANVLVVKTDSTTYTVRLLGVQPSSSKSTDQAARQFLSRLVLEKRVQLRLEYRDRSGILVCRVLTLLTPSAKIRDLGVELVRGGLATKQASVDYKYHELAAAQKEARSTKRGLWRGQR